MRQAGRYLPEYQALRKRAGGFLELCFRSELAAEATLQPVRRFSFDAAILFSDILVIPHALGQRVQFEEGEGPRLEPIADSVLIHPLAAGGLWRGWSLGEGEVPRREPIADSVLIDRLAAEVDQNVLGPVYETIR